MFFLLVSFSLISSLMHLPVTFPLQTIATVCMFIAGKVERGTRLDLEELIVVSNEIIHKKAIAPDQRQVSLLPWFFTFVNIDLFFHFFCV